MLKILAVMTGGSIGAACRYLLFLATRSLAGASFPTGTLAANLLGSFLIGLLWSFFEGSRLTNEWRLFIFTGFLGGFTTFSTFGYETLALARDGDHLRAGANVLLTVVLCLVAVWLGHGFGGTR